MIATRDVSRQISLVMFISLLAACGGGGSSTTTSNTTATASLTGTFVDAPVAGLSYTTSSGGSGTTDAEGQFNYAAGDTVTFSVGGLTLGSADPSVTTAGNAVITPVSIISGATDPTDPKVTAIGQLFGTLNSIAVAGGAGANGVYTIPSNATTLLSQLGTIDITSITSIQLQTVVSAAGVGSVTSSTDAQANMNQGINAASVVGTTWSGTCTCGGGGTFYFEPNGNLTGFTADGELLAGTWTGSSTASGGIQISLVSSGGGYTQNGAIPAGSSTGTADIYDSNNALQGTLTFSQITSSNALSNTLYLGGWYATYTPNSTGTAAGDSGGRAYIILSPDGTFHGITDGAQEISGTWDPSTGIGTASFDNGSGGTVTISVNVNTKSGTVAVDGTDYGSLSFSRTGTLTMNADTHTGGTGTSGGSVNTIPLLLSVHVSWPANVGNVVSSFALSLSAKDSNGGVLASAIKSEVNPFGAGAAANTTTDNIAVSYAAGSAASYSLSVGPSNCSIGNGSGSVIDANANNASAYPTVNITCN
jgi:hypothetical protein